MASFLKEVTNAPILENLTLLSPSNKTKGVFLNRSSKIFKGSKEEVLSNSKRLLAIASAVYCMRIWVFSKRLFFA